MITAISSAMLAVGGVAVGAAGPAAVAASGNASGAPVCVHVGTRSEGWAWPGGRFIHWAKCKGVVPACLVDGKKGEGWYAHGALIAPAACGGGGSGTRKPAQTDDAAQTGGADQAGPASDDL